jgi:Fe-S cluster assembly iron-binding protein IscA
LNIIVDEDLENAVEGLSIDYKEGLFKKDFEIKPLY